MKKESIKNTTRGGQVILHNLRMIGQVLHKTILWLFPVGCLAAIGWFYLITQPDTRLIGWQWVSAEFHLFFNSSHFKQHFIFPSGQTMTVTVGQIVSVPFVQEAVNTLKFSLQRSLWVGLIVWLCAVVGVLVWLRRRGEAYTADKSLKGDQLGDVKTVKKLIRSQGLTSDLVFGKEKLPLPQSAELQHILVHGTTGTGKSTVIKTLLDHIRQRGERAIVYDKSCSLVSQFFQPNQDHLLNPLDQRGADWSIWEECRDKTDFDNLAAALIPMAATAQDPFWVNAARTIFAAAAFRLREESHPKILPLLRQLLTADLGQLQSLLRGTEAESLISEKTEKTAISIKSVLATYLKSLCYIHDDQNPFSIRRWIQQDHTREWLFISSLGDRHESLKPLITAWLDIAVNALLSLPENPERRIWVILDELGSLQQLPYLTSALAEARKFGGCFVIGIQSMAQLAKTYGFEGGREISALLNTRFLFRIPEPEIALWSAKNLGETTIEEVREGFSYGANTIRDGVSVQRVEVQKPVVPASEILRLDNLTCYVRLPGSYPITLLHMPYVERPIRQPAFCVRAVESDPLRREVETRIDQKDFSTADEPKKAKKGKKETKERSLRSDQHQEKKSHPAAVISAEAISHSKAAGDPSTLMNAVNSSLNESTPRAQQSIYDQGISRD
jgi:type IV conjugative transfer system coupling protein TraD